MRDEHGNYIQLGPRMGEPAPDNSRVELEARIEEIEQGDAPSPFEPTAPEPSEGSVSVEPDWKECYATLHEADRKTGQKLERLEARIEALANEWGRRGLPRNPDILKRILASRTSELRAALTPDKETGQ